ncbi:retrotransposon protein, putative, ty1-copia subclass [Tanacetum coccineum]|uniref:Retrotransposon protein, putative, ty1-copia subclass n=1 Tax=Tanacetum coccineum TaxID=301880 RepID=A0ABQ5HQW4_9ASTR
MIQLNYLEQPLPPAPVAPAGQHVAPEILAAHTAWVKGSKEIAGLMLMTMEPEIQRNLENLHANDMLKELKTLFAQQAEHELLQTTRDFHACRQEEGLLHEQNSYLPKNKRSLLYMLFELVNPERTLEEELSSVLIAELLKKKRTHLCEQLVVQGLRATKLDLDSALLWHCRLGHISKKRIEKLQHDGLLNSTDLRAFEKCVPCMSGKDGKKTLHTSSGKGQRLTWTNTHRYIRAIRILIAIAAYYDYEIWQMDVKTAFLNGYLNEEVYMEQPEGLSIQNIQTEYALKRSIYGLKQASRQWNKRFDDEIKKFGFSQNADEPCVYLKASGSNVTFLILYVDDILIMGNSIPMLQDVKSYLGKCFAMKDLGEAAYILGIKIYRDRSRRLIGLCQSAYIEKILKRFHMENSKRGSIPMQDKLRLSKSQGASTPAELKRMQSVPYASAVGSIMYAVRCTRPDVAFAQNITSRFQQNPGARVSCYTDVGYLTDADDLKSQTGYVFDLNGCAVDWKECKQSICYFHLQKAEYDCWPLMLLRKCCMGYEIDSGLGVVPYN